MKGKLLGEVLVYIIQISLAEDPIGRLIGAAAASGTQPSQRSDPPAALVSVGINGDSAQMSCASVSAKNRSDFLLQTPGEDLLEHFTNAVHSTTVHPSPHQAPQAVHRIKGRQSEGVGGSAE